MARHPYYHDHDGYYRDRGSNLLATISFLVALAVLLGIGYLIVPRILAQYQSGAVTTFNTQPTAVIAPRPSTAPFVPIRNPVQSAPVVPAVYPTVPPQVAPPAVAPEQPAPPPVDVSVPEQINEIAAPMDQAYGGGWAEPTTGAVLPFDPNNQAAVDTMNRALANSGQPTMTPAPARIDPTTEAYINQQMQTAYQ